MTFLDSEILSLLDERLDAFLFTCVGVPEYASAAGGMPGPPTDIRTVTPRLVSLARYGAVPIGSASPDAGGCSAAVVADDTFDGDDSPPSFSAKTRK
jgi:hypothetical protein